MSQQRQLREYELVRMMIVDPQLLRAEYVSVLGQPSEPLTERQMVAAILERQFPHIEELENSQ